jgi:HD superfamily phosphohydrolase
MQHFDREALSHDPIHGYIPFVSGQDLPKGEASERSLIDHPWVQRLRHIHQLQTAWWIFPTAEHTRFQHVLGVMHLGSRLAQQLYPSLREVHPDCPSQPYIESVLRIAGLLHDVGHGPFGHFFDTHFLSQYGLTHETLGKTIIEDELGTLIQGIRRNPNGELRAHETLDPRQISWLICRPKPGTSEDQPLWLAALRSLLSGIYTIDNMDFVLRDAFMSGYSMRSFDLDRLIRYSFFSAAGLTIVDRGIEALVRFMSVRADLFRTIYFHRAIRAIDLTLEDLFRESRDLLFPVNPLNALDDYLGFTESSLLVDVSRWHRSSDPQQRHLGERWQQLLSREIPWKMACQRTQTYLEGDSENASIFSDASFVEKRLREHLPQDLRDLPMRVDLARHMHRPHTHGPASGQNFLFDSARQSIRPLSAHDLYQRLPVSARICRVYIQQSEFASVVAHAFDQVAGGAHADDLTNM